MNRVVALKNHKNRIVTTVPRFRASPRHGGVRQFLEFFSHLNRRTKKPCFGVAAFIATVNDEPSLIISYYHDLQGKSCIMLMLPISIIVK